MLTVSRLVLHPQVSSALHLEPRVSLALALHRQVLSALHLFLLVASMECALFLLVASMSPDQAFAGMQMQQRAWRERRSQAWMERQAARD